MQREKEAPEEVSRTEELSNKIELSLLLVLCHFMPEDLSPYPDIQRTFSRATKVTVEEQSQPDCGAGRWQHLLDVDRKAFPTAGLT